MCIYIRMILVFGYWVFGNICQYLVGGGWHWTDNFTRYDLSFSGSSSHCLEILSNFRYVTLRRHHLGATVSALGLLSAGTFRHRRFSAGRFGAAMKGDSQ